MPRTNKEVVTDDSEAATRADARVLARGIGGALPRAAIGTLVNLDFAAEEGMLFRHRHLLLYVDVRLRNA